jgi:uncharacterized protein YecE (DUF72 family)
MNAVPKHQVWVGPAGWSYPDWEGIVYPPKPPRSFDPLEYLSSYFDLIEINSTFYRVPPRATCRRWVERVASRPDFVFTAKAPQEITHGGFPASDREIAEFKAAIEPLLEGGRLGALLVQFPWSFKATPEGTAYVEFLAERLAPYPTVFEMRHGSWGAPHEISFFRESGLALCGIDQPLIGDSLCGDSYVSGGNLAYFRLHGRNRENWFGSAGRNERYNYLYHPSELSPWSARVREAAKTVERVFVVLNNHFRGQAVVNSLQLRSMLTGAAARGPRSLVSAYPEAGILVRSDDFPTGQRSATDGTQLGLFEKDDEKKNDDDSDQHS